MYFQTKRFLLIVGLIASSTYCHDLLNGQCPGNGHRIDYLPIQLGNILPGNLTLEPQIVPTSVAETVASTPQTSDAELLRQARNKTDVAKAYFRTKQYVDSQRYLDQVVKLVPNDTNAYQFRSLVFFAQFKYDDAAADAFDALRLGNTWTVDVLDSVYPKAAIYHEQLDQLKRATEKSPSMSNHFLLAYHYLMLNDLENGRKQLEQVLVLQPEEPLSTQLLAVVNAKIKKGP